MQWTGVTASAELGLNLGKERRTQGQTALSKYVGGAMAPAVRFGFTDLAPAFRP